VDLLDDRRSRLHNVAGGSPADSAGGQDEPVDSSSPGSHRPPESTIDEYGVCPAPGDSSGDILEVSLRPNTGEDDLAVGPTARQVEPSEGGVITQNLEHFDITGTARQRLSQTRNQVAFSTKHRRFVDVVNGVDRFSVEPDRTEPDGRIRPPGFLDQTIDCSGLAGVFRHTDHCHTTTRRGVCHVTGRLVSPAGISHASSSPSP
jgi:hypothetical protein